MHEGMFKNSNAQSFSVFVFINVCFFTKVQVTAVKCDLHICIPYIIVNYQFI